MLSCVHAENPPVLLKTQAQDAKWITSPEIAAIKKPMMQWADFDQQGKPFAKDPTVVRFNGRYLMYFSLPPNTISPQKYGWTCAIAESDDLINWRKVKQIVPMQECDQKGTAAPCARVWNDRVHLFYQTYGNGPNDAICYAWSDDGVNFTPHPQNPIFRPHGEWTNGRAIDADAFIFKDKLFLYCATRDPSGQIQKIAVATADPTGLDDPLNRLGPTAWTQACTNSILEPLLTWETKCIEATTVCQRGDTLVMFYAGGYNNNPQQIGVAHSDDGINWTRLWDVPFIPNGNKDSWNSSESGHPGVFVDDNGQTYLFYQGNAQKGASWYLSRVKIGWCDAVPFVIDESKE
ncbi:MAG: family 43 glycosylhydrolase [Thermoguttaceae bacterium]